MLEQNTNNIRYPDDDIHQHRWYKYEWKYGNYVNLRCATEYL